MYKIEAIIRPHLFDAVREALEDLDIIGATTFDCRGTGHQPEVAHTFRGSHYAHALAPRLAVVAVVKEAQLEEAVAAIQKAASTGEVGDGKIFVTKIHEVVRIRTNEKGDAALS